ncbi:MAG: hypothetical protein WBF67_05505 [Olleya sp.]
MSISIINKTSAKITNHFHNSLTLALFFMLSKTAVMELLTVPFLKLSKLM